MTSATDICNRALAEIGSRTVINDMTTESSPAAVNCNLFYTPMRQMLLRGAPWAFTARTVILTELGTLAEGTAPYPWLAKYAYPSDCLKMRYILPPPVFPPSGDAPDVSTDLLLPWCPPSRQWRYKLAFENGAKVLVANLLNIYGVYTADVVNPDLWDPLFANAMVMGLASKLIMPLTGNVAMKQGFMALATDAVNQARATDANESISSTDHSVDWIAARVGGGYYPGQLGGFGGDLMGDWYWAYDNLNWSM